MKRWYVVRNDGVVLKEAVTFGQMSRFMRKHQLSGLAYAVPLDQSDFDKRTAQAHGTPEELAAACAAAIRGGDHGIRVYE